MKKSFYRPAAAALAALFLLPAVYFSPQTEASAASETVIDLNNLSVFTHTKAEIVDKYNNAQFTSQAGSFYSDTGSNASNAYRASALTTDAKNTLLRQTNYYRWLAGMNSLSLSADSTKWDNAGKGAVMLSKSAFSHTPARPSDMPQSFYTGAYEGTSKSSIALTSYESGKPVLQFTLRQWLNDDDAANFSMPGHRNTFLTRNAESVAYGFFTDENEVTTSCQTIIYNTAANPQGYSVKGNNEAAYPWPAPGYFPVQEITPQAPWTITFNNDKAYYSDISDLRIIITDMSDGSHELRTYSNGGIMEDTTYWGNTVSFEPPTTADYTKEYSSKTYKVSVSGLKNSSGNSLRIDYNVNFFSLFDQSVGSHISSDSIVLGDTLTIYGSSSRDTSGTTYGYSYSKDGSTWYSISGSSGTLSYKPTAAGEYIFRVAVKDPSKGTSYRYLSSEVLDEFVNVSMLSSTQIELGDSVTIRGLYKGKSSSEHLYTYSYVNASTGGSFTAIKEKSSDTTCTFKPTSTGTYYIMIGITDRVLKGNTYVTTTYNLQLPMIVTEKTSKRLVNRTTISPQTIRLGSSITLKAAAKGGSGSYTYKFSYNNLSNSSDTSTTFKSSGGGVYTFTPQYSGTYRITSTARDSKGVTASFYDDIIVEAPDPLVNKSYATQTTFKVGETTVIRGLASGGKAPYSYTYQYKRSTASTWNNMGSGNSISFKPSSAGTFNIRVYVKDSTGSTVCKSLTLKATGEALSNASYVSDTTFQTGTAIKIYSVGKGGTGSYTYLTEMKRSYASTWTNIGSSYVVTFKPGSSGTFNIRTTIKDSSGTVAVKTFTVTATSALLNTSTITNTSFTVGNSTYIKGGASGGSGSYSFTYYYKRNYQSSWTTLGSGPSVTFKPGSAGSFQLKSVVSDSSGTKAEKIFDVTAS